MEPETKPPLFENMRDLDLLKAAYGFHLRGHPATRRVYFVKGEPGGGKSALANAIMSALGRDYAEPIQDSVIRPAKAGAKAPELLPLTRPHRIAVCGEMDPEGKIDRVKLKQITGEVVSAVRVLYKNSMIFHFQAVMFFYGNAWPTVGLRDEAVFDRAVFIRGPRKLEKHEQSDQIGKVFPAATKRGRNARQSMMARLVRWAVENPTLPVETERALELKEQRAANEDDELLATIEASVEQGEAGDFLAYGDVWIAVLNSQGLDFKKDFIRTKHRIAGANQTTIRRFAQQAIPALADARPPEGRKSRNRVDCLFDPTNKNYSAQGWWGWKLKDEVRQAIEDRELQLRENGSYDAQQDDQGDGAPENHWRDNEHG